jgi:hypothetical protein
MHSLAFECIEVRRQRSNEGLSLSSGHLCKAVYPSVCQMQNILASAHTPQNQPGLLQNVPAIMENHTAHHLDIVVTQLQDPPARLSDYRKNFIHDVVQSFSFLESGTEKHKLV